MARNPAAIDMFIIGRRKNKVVFFPFFLQVKKIKLVETFQLLDHLAILYLYFFRLAGLFKYCI